MPVTLRGQRFMYVLILLFVCLSAFLLLDPFNLFFLGLYTPPPFRENLGMLCTTPYSNNLVTNCKFCFVFCQALVTLNSLAKEPIPSTSSGQRKTKRIKKQKITLQNSSYE